MNKTFDSLFDLDECTVIGERDDFAVDFRPDWIFVLNVFPWMRLKLFVSQRNSFLFLVEVQHDDVDGLIELYNF